MTTGGWIFMIGSIGTVVTMLTFCFARVLKGPPSTDADARDRNG